MDARSIRFSHWPWCTADESPVSPDGAQNPPGDYIKRHFLHQCGCPVPTVLYTLTRRTDTKCGYPAFVATVGVPRKIFAVLKDRVIEGAWREACAGMEKVGIVYRNFPERESAIERTRAFVRTEGPDGVTIDCQAAQEDVSPEWTPPDPCATPEARRETENWVHDYAVDCTPNYAEYESLVVSPMGGSSATAAPVPQTPPPATETLNVSLLQTREWTHAAQYEIKTNTPTYWNPTGCGDQVSTVESSVERIPLSAGPDAQTLTEQQELSEEVTDYTLTDLHFQEGKTSGEDITAYSGIQTDDGRMISQAVKLCLLLENLLVGVTYRARITFKRRTRTLDATGQGFVYGPWEYDGAEDFAEFEADKRAMVLGGEWLSDTLPTSGDAVVEYDIPEDAEDFASVREAYLHNEIVANVRADVSLAENADEGYEYALHEAVVWPTTGTHIHEETV